MVYVIVVYKYAYNSMKASGHNSIPREITLTWTENQGRPYKSAFVESRVLTVRAVLTYYAIENVLQHNLALSNACK